MYHIAETTKRPDNTPSSAIVYHLRTQYNDRPNEFADCQDYYAA